MTHEEIKDNIWEAYRCLNIVKAAIKIENERGNSFCDTTEAGQKIRKSIGQPLNICV